jgi:hypothetical protein
LAAQEVLGYKVQQGLEVLEPQELKVMSEALEFRAALVFKEALGLEFKAAQAALGWRELLAAQD